MKLAQITAGVLVAASLAIGTAQADSQPERFAALGGVQATEMSAAEMEATTGELNGYDILAPAIARARTPEGKRLLMAAAEAMNAGFKQAGLLTKCVSCYEYPTQSSR